MAKTTIPAGGIADSAVTTAKINADAITDAKIADGVVGTEHLTDTEITFGKLSTSGTEGDNVKKRVGKVWVQFNGTGTVAIQSDFNVGTISDYGTGQYGVNFSTALADDDFAAVTGGVKGTYGAGNRINDLSTSLCKIDNWSTSAYTDSAIITLVLMGNSS